MVKTGDRRKEYLPNYTPTPKTQSLPGWNSELAEEPLDTYLPGGIGDDYNAVEQYKAAGKLKGRAALITGGDSGIGRAVAILFAMEGADVAINYLPAEQEDAEITKKEVEKYGGQCFLIPEDLLGGAPACQKIIETTIKQLGHLEILVNNAGTQMQCDNFEDIPVEQIDHTFRVNILAMMYLTKYALPHLKRGASIINCASVNPFIGQPVLCDYSASKGAVVGFTRSLAKAKAEAGIRVNAVAPGPIHTPLVQATFKESNRTGMHSAWPMLRVGQPVEVATAFVFLASPDSSYFTAQCLHPNGGVPM